jgi:hypothetical protein
MEIGVGWFVLTKKEAIGEKDLAVVIGCVFEHDRCIVIRLNGIREQPNRVNMAHHLNVDLREWETY